MIPHIRPTLCLRNLANVSAIAAALALPPAAAAQTPAQSAFLDPGAIDEAVAGFTGVAAGEIGGARLPADRRLRLASCAVPLDVAWHGRAKASVRVACPGPQAWQIFIALRTPAPAERAAPAIARGDPLTIQIRGRGFTIQKPGEAMEAGGVGECIAVSTGRGSETLRARIERPGLAVIPAG